MRGFKEADREDNANIYDNSNPGYASDYGKTTPWNGYYTGDHFVDLEDEGSPYDNAPED